MIRSCIPEYLDYCPQGWRNFIADMRLRIEPNDSVGFSEDTIQAELDKFCADYENPSPWLVFKDERLYNLFILKYGPL